MILYSYTCKQCAHDFEEFAPLAKYKRAAPCPICGGFAPRRMTFPTIDPRLGIDAESFPSMGRKWKQVRDQRAVIEKNREYDHGTLDHNKGTEHTPASYAAATRKL